MRGVLESGMILALLLAAAPAFAALEAKEDSARVLLRNDRLTLSLGKAAKGAILSLVDNATGKEFVAPQTTPKLFRLVFSRAGNTSERFTLASSGASTFTARLQTAGPRRTAVLEFQGFADQPIQITCTASIQENDPLVRWRLSARYPESLVLEEVQFPLCVLRAPLGNDPSDDAVVLGLTKGGVRPSPAGWKPGEGISGRQPGSLAAQFACYYDGQAGFFTAAYDGKGHPKNCAFRRTAEGFEAEWNPQTFTPGAYALDFDIVQTTFTGANGAPADWRDAADIYKAWALTQPWCATTFARRPDIPAWMKAGPAQVRFNRTWLANPTRAEKWLTEYWGKHFKGIPLITAYWGWEKIDSWVTPDYFPVFPSDEQFTRLVAVSRKMGAHAFPWPSGYHWTLTFRKQNDGSFEWDDRERFDRVARAHAIHTRDGQLYIRKPSWLAGGETACMCPGDPWTINWWNHDISVPLAKRGCEMIQVDQVVGGNFPYCYSKDHGHPPGPGPWMTEVFTRQLRTMYAECRKVERDAVVCFEEPNELFNHLIGIQDYRDTEARGRLASVFNYLYHEFLPPFQSNPRGGDTFQAAYCFADGQMPHLMPSMQIGEGPLLDNGGFEEWTGRSCNGWEQVRAYQGRNWNGTFARDTQEKHGGQSSLRLENTSDTDTVQVSRNLSIGGSFQPGRKYRLSAWVKTAELAQPNAIGMATFAPGLKANGAGGKIPFPEAGAGWTHGAAEFTVPEGTAMLRIMMHVDGKAKVWVDDMLLEEVLPDGKTTPVARAGVPPDHKLMHGWVHLYHGEGRPYLQHGRMLHPPKLVAGTTEYRGYQYPAVLHNAFRAADGSEAVVVVNATDAPQKATLTWKGKEIALDLAPGDSRLIR